MWTRVTIMLSILGLVLPAATFAQGFAQGDKNLFFSASGESSDDFDNTPSFVLSGHFGYFFTPNFEGSIRQAFGFSDTVSESSWSATTSVAVDYHFDLGRWWPFVGASVGYIYGDDVADTWALGPEAGVRYFVNETTYILGMIQFLWTEEDGEDDLFDDGKWAYLLGIGFRW